MKSDKLKYVPRVLEELNVSFSKIHLNYLYNIYNFFSFILHEQTELKNPKLAMDVLQY